VRYGSGRKTAKVSHFIAFAFYKCHVVFFGVTSRERVVSAKVERELKKKKKSHSIGAMWDAEKSVTLVGRGEFIEAIQTNRLEKSSVLREIIGLEAGIWQEFVVVFGRPPSNLVGAYSS
jgi:hypothetical protein